MNIYYTNNISSFYKYESSMILHGFIRTFCIKNHIPKASTISCLCLKTKKKKKIVVSKQNSKYESSKSNKSYLIYLLSKIEL